MNVSRTVIVFLALAPSVFGASKEIQELQRDVAMLQDQVRNLQSALDTKVAAMQALVQQTLDSVNKTNTAMAIMDNKFSDAMKQQQQSLNGPVANVGQKLDQMSEDFRAVRESVLDMNTRMGKLDAKMADLQNMINTLRTPPPPPPGATPGTAPDGSTQSQGTATAPAGPPPGVTAETTYSNAYRDYIGGKYDLAQQEFVDYLKYFPNTQFDANAQYYLGQIYYQKKDYLNAVQAFDAVLEQYADNNRTPDSHYFKAMSLMSLGKNDSAAQEFRDVYSRYLESEPDLAAKAKARLKEMGLTVGTVARKRRAR
ncbi:MAG TPA: tetratricopeptide repeat protein [Bryobacteraceae bacterium]|nr:tetratricopeptide repeat protein [Bryobacteraceae bacterium]